MAEKVQAGNRRALAAAEADLFKALAHPARARVLGALVDGPASVQELCDATGLKPTHLAGHLTQLRAQRLVKGQREGGRLFYFLAVPGVGRILTAADSVLVARSAAENDGLATGPWGPDVQNEGNLSVSALAAELLPVLEQSSQSRTLIAEAVESLRRRSGISPEEARTDLLAEALAQHHAITQAAKDVLSHERPGNNSP